MSLTILVRLFFISSFQYKEVERMAKDEKNVPDGTDIQSEEKAADNGDKLRRGQFDSRREVHVNSSVLAAHL